MEMLLLSALQWGGWGEGVMHAPVCLLRNLEVPPQVRTTPQQGCRYTLYLDVYEVASYIVNRGASLTFVKSKSLRLILQFRRATSVKALQLHARMHA